ncbi:hypothetical protein RB195_015211 [Necator americanus]|uniref:7TM GPCR serpentine receptor class x (Srx) domain-containing protein n=1 Tax=Necator americanus TaxID=51031 RepID=A0ABR1E416_NECAM
MFVIETKEVRLLAIKNNTPDITHGLKRVMYNASDDDIRKNAAVMCNIYIYLGFISAVCNIVNIITMMSNTGLRERCTYLIAFNICELFNGGKQEGAASFNCFLLVKGITPRI